MNSFTNNILNSGNSNDLFVSYAFSPAVVLNLGYNTSTYTKKILKRDRRNHKSPNSGYPESATAGLLGIQLGGGNYYHGLYVEKPHIGDKINDVNKEHIKNTVEIMYRSEIAFLMFYYLIIFIRR